MIGDPEALQRATETAAAIDAAHAVNDSPFAKPVCITQLREGDATPWVWEGYLAPGAVTLLIGLFKAGKTTLISWLLKSFNDGTSLAGYVEPCRVLVVSEEHAGLWATRRDEIGIGGHVYCDLRPFVTRPSWKKWEQYAGYVTALVKAYGYKVVIFDTWSSISPTPDENAAAEMMRALKPLHGIANAGAAVLLVHHPNKGDNTEGRASRGSGALPGFVDIILELRRFDAERRDDRRRTLVSYSRYPDTPAEQVIELTETGYRACGTKGDASRDDRWAVIAEILPEEGDGYTSFEVRDDWVEDTIPKPSERTLRRDLVAGADKGLWLKTGMGTRIDPFKFRTTLPIGVGAVRNTKLANNNKAAFVVPDSSQPYKGTLSGMPANSVNINETVADGTENGVSEAGDTSFDFGANTA